MTPYEKGKVLEKAVELFLRDMGFRVYSWEEWARKMGISAKDLGGDLVAEMDGKIYLVQCKNWERRVGWKDLGSFIGLLITKNFDGGYIFAKEITTDADKNLPKNVIFISIEEEEFQEYLKEAEDSLQGKKIEKRPKELRPYQKEAIRRIIEGFKEKDRGQLLMPPGTGKTLVALKVKVYGIPDFAFEYRVGGYPPIRRICDYMKRNEDKESGIVWDPKIKVGEFISLTRKLITLSKRTLEIKKELSKVIKPL
jgi:predicted helicase